MSNELERFVNDNRDEFDDKNVPAGLWDKIEQQIQPKKFTRRSFSEESSPNFQIIQASDFGLLSLHLS